MRSRALAAAVASIPLIAHFKRNGLIANDNNAANVIFLFILLSKRFEYKSIMVKKVKIPQRTLIVISGCENIFEKINPRIIHIGDVVPYVTFPAYENLPVLNRPLINPRWINASSLIKPGKNRLEIIIGRREIAIAIR